MILPTSVVLSPSRVEGAVKCQRKHALSEICGQQPTNRAKPALEFGERMHAAAAARWRHDDPATGQDVLANFAWPLNDKHTLTLAMQMWSGYVAQARLMPFGDAAEWEIVTIEDRATLNLDGFDLSFQIDRLLRHRSSGALALIDLKTASRCDARWTGQWPRSLQMKLYSECVARHYGQPLTWLIIEGLSKDKAAVNYVAVPEHSAEVRAEAMRVVEYVAKQDAQLLDDTRLEDGSIDAEALLVDSLVYTAFNPAECFSFNSPCDYLPLCEAEPSERRSLLAEGYTWVQPKHLV